MSDIGQTIPYGSTEDTSEAAKFYLLTQDYVLAKRKANAEQVISRQMFDEYMDSDGTFLFDLVISSVSHNHGELGRVESYFGDVFAAYFHGRSPISMHVIASLFTLQNSKGKAHFMAAYRDILRITRVAKSLIVPVLTYNGYHVQCAMTNLSVDESSNSDDTIQLSFDLIVFNMLHQKDSSTTSIQNYNFPFVTVTYDQTAEVDLIIDSNRII